MIEIKFAVCFETQLVYRNAKDVDVINYQLVMNYPLIKRQIRNYTGQR